MYQWFLELNPLVKAILASIFLLMLTLLACTIIINSPFYLERPWEEPDLGEVYSFKDWEIQLDHMDINFSQGIVLLGYQHEQLTGVLIKGNGNYNVHVPAQSTSEKETMRQSGDIEAVYLPVTDNLLEELKGNVIFSPISNSKLDFDYSEYFEAEKSLLADIETFNIRRTIHPGDSLNMAYLFGDDYDAKFHEHKSVMFSVCDGERTQLTSTNDRSPYPPANFYSYTMLYMLVSLVLLSLLVYIFTVDIHENLYKVTLNNKYMTLFTAVFATGGFFFFRWIDLETNLNLLEHSGFFVVLSAMLVMLHLKENRQLHELGIRITNIIRSLIIAFLLAIVILGLSTLMIPSGFSFPQGLNLLYLSSLLGVGFFFQELVLRSFLLGSLEKLLGANKGLAMHAVIFVIINSVLLILTETHQAFGFYFNSTLDILIMPVITAVFLGYIYQRTRNIFCPVFLQLFVVILTNSVYF